MRAWIGIDPGKTGAAAIVTASGHFLVRDHLDTGYSRWLLSEWSREYECTAALEEPGKQPRCRRGTNSSYVLGVNVGQWQGLLTAAGIDYRMVAPREWQKAMVNPFLEKPFKPKGPKERAINTALAVMPELKHTIYRKKDHGRADAVLLALWRKRVDELECARLQ